MLKKGVVLVKKLFIISILAVFSAHSFAESKSNVSIEPMKERLEAMKMRTIVVGDKVTHLMDYNKNGVADAEYMYIDGKLYSEKLDHNNDGKWDRSSWYYQSGEVISTTTLDTNLDGKVDVKIVKTTKNAKSGFFIKKIYSDKDFDGKFDSKKTFTINNHQAAAASAPGHNHCINCEIRAMEQAHYPAVLNNDTEDILFDLMEKVRNTSLENQMYSRPGISGELGYTFNIQPECKTSDQHKNLLTRTNITEGLKKGLGCMEKLARPGALNVASINGVNRTINANHNLFKAVAGLVGYDYFGKKNGREDFVPHGQYVSFVCKPPARANGLFTPVNSRTVLARATIQRRDGLDNHINRLKDHGYSAPNIAFNPRLSTELRRQPLDYAGQNESAKMQKLIFHEFLHTSLGTEHSPDEDMGDYRGVDYADTCADFCFNNPASGDALGTEIKRISGEICGGNFTMPNAFYRAKKARLKCLKERYVKLSDKNSTDAAGSSCPAETPALQ
jgi:hypothetical protein